MISRELAIPVKLWALVCTSVGVTLVTDMWLSGGLALVGLVYLAAQRKGLLVRGFGLFLGVLALLLALIRYAGLQMLVFSEFHVLLFWTLLPVVIVGWDLITTPPGEMAAFLSRLHAPPGAILGLLVMFRFFPTMRTEWCGVWRSMKNRGLTAPLQLLRHPLASCEYVLVPMLLRCLQVADQLAVSAVARGAECPVQRGSYYAHRMALRDGWWMVVWALVTVCVLWLGG